MITIRWCFLSHSSSYRNHPCVNCYLNLNNPKPPPKNQNFLCDMNHQCFTFSLILLKKFNTMITKV